MLQMIHMYTIVLHVALPAVLFFLYGQDRVTDLRRWSDLAGEPAFLVMTVFAVLGIVASQMIPGKLAAAGKDPKTVYIVKLCLMELCVVSGFGLGLLYRAPEIAVPFAAIGLAMVLKSPPPRAHQ